MQTTPGTSLTDPATGLPARRSVLGLCLTVCAVVWALDLLTKTWAQQALADGLPRPLVGDLLRLHLTHNPGAAFSTGTSYTAALTVIAIGVIVVCITMARRMRSRGWAIALGLILGGALGNVTDRLFRAPSPFQGHVVDFIELPHYPIFNLADSAIFCAAILIIWLTWRGIKFDGTLVPGSRADKAARERAGRQPLNDDGTGEANDGDRPTS